MLADVTVMNCLGSDWETVVAAGGGGNARDSLTVLSLDDWLESWRLS